MTQSHEAKIRKQQRVGYIATCACGWQSHAEEHKSSAGWAWIDHHDEATTAQEATK